MHQDNCVTFYMSGNKCFEGKMEFGKKQGICREYHFNGRLRCEELFVDDFINGDSVTIYSSYDNKDQPMRYAQSGVVVFEDIRKTIKEDKDAEIEVPEGIVGPRKAVYKGQFKNGKRHGFGMQFYEQTQCLEYIGFYNEDLPDSKFAKMYHDYNYYAPNTEPPSIEDVYELCEEVLIKQEFDENTKNHYIDIIRKNLKELGVQYIKKGFSKYEGGLKNSLYEGPGIMYSLNGNLHMKGSFCRNKGHGEKNYSYYRDGHLMHIGPMTNGYFEEKGCQYYENGRLNFRGLFQSNNMTNNTSSYISAGISYHPNGQIKTIFGKNFSKAGTL